MKNIHSKLIATLKKQNIKDNPVMGILIPVIVIMLVTQVFNHDFLTYTNISSILKSIPFIALATLGSSFVLIVGEVDISIGRIAGLAGMIFGICLTVYDYSFVISVLIAILSGAFIGLVNGYLVVYVKINSFVVTMGTLYICGGLRYLVNGGTVMTLPKEFRSFSTANPFGISWFFWMVIATFIIIAFVQRKTVFGRQLYAVGCNKEVASLQGVKVKKVKMIAFLISGIFAAIAGVMAAIDINSAQPSTGTNWEFKAVAACVLGGVSLRGGIGSATGVGIGVFIVFIINNIINMIGLSNYWSDVFTGCILAGAITVDIIRQRQKIKA